jgi:undecaprenol kinase/diacylglycerol kinase (ATP)
MKFFRSLLCALAGLSYGIRTQRHLRFHLLATVIVVGAGLKVGLSQLQWVVLILTIAAVISAELFNTAIEAVVDLVSPDYHQLAKAAKDTAAAAVLVASIAAVIVGVVIFWPRF